MDEALFFRDWPQLFGLYMALRERLTARYPDMAVRVSKTQISFYNRHMFAMASLPVRRKKEWPGEFLMVSFGLARRAQSSRIAVCTEAYPGRFTHHVIVEREEELDDELMAWIGEAYDFALSKR